MKLCYIFNYRTLQWQYINKEIVHWEIPFFVSKFIVIRLIRYPSASTSWFYTLFWDTGVQNTQTVLPRLPCQLADWEVLPIGSTRWYWKGCRWRETFLPHLQPGPISCCSSDDAWSSPQLLAVFPKPAMHTVSLIFSVSSSLLALAAARILGHQSSLFALSALQWLCNDLPNQVDSIWND